MTVQPHWDMLCRESKIALYLTVMMIPLEVFVLATVAVESFMPKKTLIVHERKGSPAMS